MARVSKERAVALAEIERDQQLAIQNERKQQEVMATEVARRQAIELAEQQRQIAVTNEQKRREAADKDRLVVSAQREEAAQAVTTVQATEAANREAKIKVIEAEREAQKAMIEQKNKIELDALRKQREAEAQAKALKETASAEAEASLKQAETVRVQAQAEVEAAKLRAEAAKAAASATGLAEADILKAKADAAMREAEAVRAKGLAEAEAEKAKAEALAAFDGVAQRVELLKLQLDAQVRIEIAKAQSLGSALASMNIKMIGDPNAAAALLRMVTMADGIGEVMKATPEPVKEVGKQLIESFTGKPLPLSSSNGNDGKDDKPASNPNVDIAQLMPEILAMIEKKMDLEAIKNQSVREVLVALSEKATKKEKATIEKAQQALETVPVLNDLPFEELYLRATVK
jgi:flotillin